MHDLFAAPAASFDDPLDMLSACHERIERQIATLYRLLSHLQEKGADAEAREAATAVLRYFQLAAPHHHADEEEDLFPALRQLDVGAEVMARILAEHHLMEGARAALMSRLQAIVDGQSSLLPREEVEAFDHLYSGHIDYEESVLLPLARRVLDAQTLQALGRRMAARRGA